MKRYFLILFAVSFYSFSLFGCNKNVTEKKDSPQKANNAAVSNMQESSPAAVVNSDMDLRKAPGFSLVDTKGKKISLSKYRGKVVILDFWATWCPPCRRGIPDLIDIQKQYKNKVAVIGVSLDTDTKKNVVPFIKNVGINYPVVYATSKIINDYGNIEAIPTTFIIDKKGNISYRYVGLQPKFKFVDDIKKLLGKS